jgi:hypothetical protein
VHTSEPTGENPPNSPHPPSDSEPTVTNSPGEIIIESTTYHVSGEFGGFYPTAPASLAKRSSRMLASHGPAFAPYRHAAWDTREKGQVHRHHWKTGRLTTMRWQRRCQTTTHTKGHANRACTIMYPAARDHVRMNGWAWSGNGTIAASLPRPFCAL